MEGADGLRPRRLACYPVGVATWARFVFVCPDADAAAFDLGPLAAAIDPYATRRPRARPRKTTEREFNWKVLVENYSENFHTPCVHPKLIVAAVGVPHRRPTGPVALAWDRPARPAGPAEEALAHATPDGRRAGAEVAANQIDDVFIAGVYFTVFPNLLVSTFPRYLSARSG